MPYTDPLEPLLDHLQMLRRAVALRLVAEAGAPPPPSVEAEHLAAADDAIARWLEHGAEEQDLRAFRPVGPLQHLLADYEDLLARIDEMRDRRLG